jgi:nucleotide-binding universal stress UspA family protein
MYRRILVPIDGSATAELGLAEAIKLAKNPHTSLCLLHVVDERVLTQTIDVGASAVDSLLESLRTGGRQILDKAQARLRKQHLKAKAVLVENIARGVADIIVEQARNWRADLIVIGTHGRRGLSRVVMGSDAEGVVRTSPVPVLLVRAQPRGRRRG